MKKSLLALATGAIFLLGACNKTKTNSKSLMKAGEWEVTELSVEGVNEDELPHWEIDDCDIYEESCMGHWENEEGGHAEFVWQFRDKGETFEISYQAEEEHGHSHEHDHAAEEAAAQAANFSGVYTVNKRDKDEMEFSSSTTQGFEGQNVIIKIKKK